MGIDSLGSRFAAVDTAKRKRASTHGLTSDLCMDTRHFRCRERGCACKCHSELSSVPRLAPRTEPEDA